VISNNRHDIRLPVFLGLFVSKITQKLKARTEQRNWTKLTNGRAAQSHITEAVIKRCLLQCIIVCPLVSSSKTKPRVLS